MKYHPDTYCAAAVTVGTVATSRAVSKSFGHAGYLYVGRRLTVRLPDGHEVSMTESEFNKRVRAATPRTTHLHFPDVRVGQVREVGLSNGAWVGQVTSVTQDTIRVAPLPFVKDGVEYVSGAEVEVGHVGPESSFRAFEVAAEVDGARGRYHAAVALVSPGAPVDAYNPAARTYRDEVATIRAKYPEITDAQFNDWSL